MIDILDFNVAFDKASLSIGDSAPLLLDRATTELQLMTSMAEDIVFENISGSMSVKNNGGISVPMPRGLTSRRRIW